MPDEIAIYVFVRVSRVVSYLRSLYVFELGADPGPWPPGPRSGVQAQKILEELVSDRRFWSLAGLC